MADYDRDEVPILSDTHREMSDDSRHSRFEAFVSRTWSASMSIPTSSMESHDSTINLVGFTGPLRNVRRSSLTQMSAPLYSNRMPGNSFVRNQGLAVDRPVERFPSFTEPDQNDDGNNGGRNEHLLRSGLLGMCNDPYCTVCPSYYNVNAAQPRISGSSRIFDSQFHNALYWDAKGWAKRNLAFLHSCICEVKNPHAKAVRRWNLFFVISFLIGVFLDPLFFFVLFFVKDVESLDIDLRWTIFFLVMKSITDLIYLLNIILQFKLAYVAPESRVVGAGELVDDPKMIASNYLRGWFWLDIFIFLPLVQIILLGIPMEPVNFKGVVLVMCPLAILVQYSAKLFRFIPLFAGQSPSGYILESGWANFGMNVILFMLFSHFVGSFWYLFGLQRVNMCLEDANLSNDCRKFIFCEWGSTNNKANCLDEKDSFGIYKKVVNLSTKNIFTRFIYSLFWGFQQISTLAGNQIPGYDIQEVLFTMFIIGLGLLALALLIGYMQNFLQGLGQRRLEESLRRRDVEQWMSHRRLPGELRRKVREAEQYHWAATRGVNEEILFQNLPEDLQRDIRRHLFKFVKKVRLFALMEDPIVDAICERLRQTTYIKDSNVFFPGGLIEKMIFIVRGRVESIGEDGIRVPLAEGGVCGEELLTWCLEHSSVNRDVKRTRIPGQRLLSNRMVVCATNVEAFSLRAADLQEVTSRFSRFLRNTRVQGAIRWKEVAPSGGRKEEPSFYLMDSSLYCRDFSPKALEKAMLGAWSPLREVEMNISSGLVLGPWRYMKYLLFVKEVPPNT